MKAFLGNMENGFVKEELLMSVTWTFGGCIGKAEPDIIQEVINSYYSEDINE